jgi:hypothetical protein
MPSLVQIEARSLAVFDAVKSGHRVEDGLVELKADWPDPQRSARRLAGHANSAHGEGILWLIGLDESRGVQPLSDVDLAEWWAQVQTAFDRVTPILTDVVVHTEDGPIHALFFDTSLSPFVVKNNAYGKPGGGSVECEVPWRDGTAVRSATRSNLIRLLSPVVHLPELEALSASVVLRIGDPAANEKYEWNFRLDLYVTPQVGTVVVFPVHRTKLEFSLNGGASNPLDSAALTYYAPSRTTFESGLRNVSDTASVETTSSEAIIHLPGRLHCSGRYAMPVSGMRDGLPMRLRYSVHPTHSERAIELEAELTVSATDKDGGFSWTSDPDVV